MTGAALTVLLALTTACAHRDISPRLERDAQAAALRHLLDVSTRDASDDAAQPSTPTAAHASPMVRATPATDDGPAPVVRAELPAPGPDAPAPELSTQPEPEDLLDRIAREGSSTSALVRAIDELRWTLQLEGRLADKQRLLDTLRGHDAPAHPANAGLDARVDALEARLQEAEQRAETDRAARGEPPARGDDDLRTRLDAAEAARASLQAEVEALRKANDTLRARIDTLEARAGSVPTRAAPAAPDDGLGERLDDHRARSRAEITALREQVRALEERLDEVASPTRRPLFPRRAPEPEAEPPPAFEVAIPYVPPAPATPRSPEPGADDADDAEEASREPSEPDERSEPDASDDAPDAPIGDDADEAAPTAPEPDDEETP